ncbi:hypothetical protein GOODEAATRI_004981 [Goodea atripinnis]|uniref:Rho-GAP domain-containing protein n=1 Tax=Goodea atripinnis TaxID=208336 RepID=A0ABV0N842_9TELE
MIRSKDIEASGFNGTAAFMEVRVQSIVVEFILTHVPQLFPLEGLNKNSYTFPHSDPCYISLFCVLQVHQQREGSPSPPRSRRSGPRPPSTNLSPVVTSSPQPCTDTTVSAGGLGSSEYAVTYRRGTGLVSGGVSGGVGTQGTYTALDPDGLGIPGSEGVQSRSPGLSNKARRAAMHITGPTIVTVPLHITSNLALGVLQGGGGDRVILRGRDKDGGDKQDGKEAGGKIEIKEPKGMEWNVEDINVGQNDKTQNETEDLDTEGNKGVAGDIGEEKNDGEEEKEDKALRKDCEHKEETQIGGQHVPREKRTKSLNSITEEVNHKNTENDDQDSEYMDESPRGTEDSQGEKCLISEASTSSSEELELPSIEDNQETNNLSGTTFEDGNEVLKESEGASLLETQHPERCAREDVTERDNTCEQSALEEPEPDGGEGPIDRKDNEEDNGNSRTNSDIWSELEDVVCEVIEDEESEQSERNAAAEGDVEEDGEAEDQDVTNKTEAGVKEYELFQTPNVGKPMDEAMGEERNEHEFNQEIQHHDREEVASEETEKEKEDTDRAKSRTQQSADKQPVISSNIGDLIEGSKSANGDSNSGGVGRKLVVSKHPKVYQVKAVPVVPPKPQHCKITALTLRQQQQQRDRKDKTLKALAEQERDGEGDSEVAEKKERPSMLREKRRDGLEGAAKDANRNSPLSMCFDEAVAIATQRREKERGREGEADPEGLGK